MALTPELEKFVADLFAITQKKQQINALAAQRQADEQALSTQYKVDELNNLRADLTSDFNNATVQIQSEIKTLEENLTK